MKQASLSHRLILTFSALFIVMLCISALFTYTSAKARIDKDYDTQLISESHLLWMMASEEVEEARGLSQIDLDFGAPSMDRPQRDALSQYTKWRAFRIWKDGRLAIQSDTAKILKAPSAPAGFSNYKNGRDIWRTYAIHVPKETLVIESWEKLDNRDRLLYGIIHELIIPALFLLPLFSFLLVMGVRYGLRDLRLMARQIGSRNPEDLSRLRFDKIPRELKPLKQAINSLLEKLQVNIEREHQFIDNAAHELKTPLAVLKLQSQLIQEAPTEKDRNECIQTLQEGIDRTRKVFDQILMLSRISGENITFEPCPVTPLLRNAIAERAALAAEKNIELSLEGDNIVAQTNPDLLSVLAGILIDNAVKYTPDGGKIEVSTSNDRIEISDNGPGIPENEKEKVFDRFYRVKGDKTQGSGLGLSIAQKCASILDTAILLEKPASSIGLKATIVFNHSKT